MRNNFNGIIYTLRHMYDFNTLKIKEFKTCYFTLENFFCRKLIFFSSGKRSKRKFIKLSAKPIYIYKYLFMYPSIYLLINLFMYLFMRFT